MHEDLAPDPRLAEALRRYTPQPPLHDVDFDALLRRVMSHHSARRVRRWWEVTARSARVTVPLSLAASLVLAIGLVREGATSEWTRSEYGAPGVAQRATTPIAPARAMADTLGALVLRGEATGGALVALVEANVTETLVRRVLTE